jgi:hypothetical protein
MEASFIYRLYNIGEGRNLVVPLPLFSWAMKVRTQKDTSTGASRFRPVPMIVQFVYEEYTPNT